MDTHGLRGVDPKDKSKALLRLGSLIKRIEATLRQKFVDIGVNTTRCARAQVALVTPQTDDLSLTEQLEQFITQFEDTETCRSHCRIDDFLLQRFQHDVASYIKHAQTLPSPKAQHNKGFVQITENLEKIVQEGATACSCRMCGRIGDAIITLEAPRTMRLEHTDYAFDPLCHVSKQPHLRHASEIEFHKGETHASSSTSNENE